MGSSVLTSLVGELEKFGGAGDVLPSYVDMKTARGVLEGIPTAVIKRKFINKVYDLLRY